MSDSELTHVLLFCQDPLLRLGLTAILKEQTDFCLQLSTPHTWDAVPPAGTPAPDVIVADYDHGMSLIAGYKARGGRSPCVLIVTPRDSEWEIRQALERGVRGYLIVGCALHEIVDGVRFVKLGMRHVCALASRKLADSVACVALTGRETEVLRLVAQGRGNKFVARELDIAIGTVKSHLKAIFEKLGAKNRTEVATMAKSRGLLDPPPGARPPPASPYSRGPDGNTQQSLSPAFH